MKGDALAMFIFLLQANAFFPFICLLSYQRNLLQLLLAVANTHLCPEFWKRASGTLIHRA